MSSLNNRLVVQFDGNRKKAKPLSLAVKCESCGGTRWDRRGRCSTLTKEGKPCGKQRPMTTKRTWRARRAGRLNGKVKGEQADGRNYNRHRGSFHAFLKRHKRRFERHKARLFPECLATYTRYRGYET